MMREDENILDSWKEIASYLDRTVKTCRKWENELGLPIHRLDGSPRASVFAYKEELDSWLENTLRRREKLSSQNITKKLITTINKRKIYIAIFIGLFATAILIWRFLMPAPSPKNSIAVLPFIDLSPNKEYEWLSDGISEAMITALSNLKGLRVPGRTSSFFFKAKEMIIKDIGHKLKVDNVLEGSVQVDGDKLRVNAQLISVKDSYQLWSDQFDRRLEDVFSIQDEIAQEIVIALKVRLMGEEKARLAKNYTENLEAYNYYLQGRYLWNLRGCENMFKSIDYFKKALEKDPKYVFAYLGLAHSYEVLGNNDCLPPAQAFPLARDFAFRALEMDDMLGEAHAVLAAVKRDYDWDWAGSDEEFKIALQLNPDSGIIHAQYAFLLSSLGRHKEAIREIFTARELDPLAPRTAANVGRILYRARKYDQALEELSKARALFPDHSNNYSYAATIYTELGRYEESFGILKNYKEMFGCEPIYNLAHTYAKMGDRDETERLIEKISKGARPSVNRIVLARLYGILGEFDQAFSLLEKSYLERDTKLRLIKIDPEFDSLRSDPRLNSLLKRMKLD
jgi:TolB-like protein/Tfp pilus assembly protein PilF